MAATVGRGELVVDTRKAHQVRIDRLNEEAKIMSRRGPCGTRSKDYALLHARLNLALFEWQQAPK